MRLDIEFAFEGFRIIRKRPWAVATWGLVFLVANIVGFGAFVALALPAFTQLFSMSAGTATPDPTVVAGMMFSLIPPYLILILVMGLAGAIVSCAIYRAALTDDKPGFGYLRFGGDELRMLLVHLIYIVLFFVVYAALAVAALALGAAFSAIDEDLVPLGIVLVFFAGIGLMVWLMIRLSLFSVQSFDEKRINVFGSWKLTKGNFWTLLGGYLLAGLLAVVVETVVMTVVWFFLILLMFANMGAWQQMANSSTPPDVATILWAVGPMMAGYIAVFSLVAWPMMIAIMVGAPAAAYRTLSGRHPRAAEKIF